MTTKIKIPWQGMVLGAGGIFVGLFIMFGSMVALKTSLMVFILAQQDTIAAAYVDMFIWANIFSYVLVITTILLTMGYFTGKRIALIVGLFAMISNILVGFFGGDFTAEIMLYKFVGFIVLGFALWLHIVCLKHPFYGGDGGAVDLRSVEGWKNIFKKGKKQRMITFE